MTRKGLTELTNQLDLNATYLGHSLVEKTLAFRLFDGLGISVLTVLTHDLILKLAFVAFFFYNST